MKRSVELNKKYNRLTVLYKVGVNKYNHALYKCLCDCGNYTVLKGTNIKNNRVKSCGCLVKELVRQKNILPLGEASFNFLYRSYKRNAKIRNYNFNLSKEEFKKLTEQSCHYCGQLPSQEAKHDINSNGYYIYTGIDRVNNDIGYILSNVVPCCGRCNFKKGTDSPEQYIEHCKKVSAFNDI